MTPDTTNADVEAALRRTFSVSIPVESRGAIDHRVQAAVAARPTNVRARRFRRPGRRVLVGIAAAALLTGTVAAGGTLFGQLIAGAPLLEDVWARATVIRQSATDAGYTIVLERAAADRDRVWVAVSVESDSGASADVARMRVTDASGVVMEGGTGAGSGDVRGVSATLFGFTVPDGVTPRGPFILDVTGVLVDQEREVAGHWVFNFDVPLTPALSRKP
jgi:hypothetical protein